MVRGGLLEVLHFRRVRGKILLLLVVSGRGRLRVARVGFSGGIEEGNLVVAPSATLWPFDCAQGRAVRVCDAGLYLGLRPRLL